VGNDRGNRLFARGPAFIKVKSPGGYVFWVGGTHMKSKSVGPAPEGETRDAKAESDLRVAATKWRNREAVRTHQILKEIESQGPQDVILVGDMNDALGMDDIEKQVGEDGLADLVGPPADGFTLATKPLIDAHQWSFNGYWRDRYREVIDHVIVSRSMLPKVKSVEVFQDNWTPVSSDHFPVLVKVVP
jgi:endonuclease/exonuclease/phosphatase family metal-dependent hydrolase